MNDLTTFQGAAKRLSQGDMGHAARFLGVETAVLLAFTEVEAAGVGFDSQGRPKMLFEPHIFYRELGNTTDRKRAMSLGLAYAKWKAGNYPRDSYPRLKSAKAISETAALRSASYGLSQILGNNHAAAGHKTVQDMVLTAMQGEREQLLQMATLMQAWGMGPMLRGRDFTDPDSWRDAAKRWNGSGYATHNYHGRMAAAYKKHVQGPVMVIADRAPVLKVGMKGEEVRNWQVDLQTLGYVFEHGIDGRFGPETEKHTLDFQRSVAITQDAKVGPGTRAAMAKALANRKNDFSPPAPFWAGQEPSGIIAAITAAATALLTLFKGR